MLWKKVWVINLVVAVSVLGEKGVERASERMRTSHRRSLRAIQVLLLLLSPTRRHPLSDYSASLGKFDFIESQPRTIGKHYHPLNSRPADSGGHSCQKQQTDEH